ncbi:MAG: hypothetical protein OEY64_10410 [Nitrospinota bacterium]|nr:hypothetical protein [Nitrospinota bacterium]
MWKPDFELSRKEKLQRNLYKTLRNELDYSLLQYGILDPYANIKKSGQEYRFVEKRELKPKGKVTEAENEQIEGFIILFCEKPVEPHLKKYIRYFDNNKVTKENLPDIVLGSSRVAPELLKTQKNFEHKRFLDLIKALLPVDYALLIQPDQSTKSKLRFSLSHFHVRIDWLIDFAAEALGKELRYVSKDLYEKGEEYAEEMVEKLFEYYSFHHTVSGRRTAALVAYQLLSSASHISTVYVNSSESRTLTKISEEGITKYCLVKIPKEHVKEMDNGERFQHIKNFRRNYLLNESKDGGVGILRIVYTHNEHSTPPGDGKLRELQPDVNWLKVVSQSLIPKPTVFEGTPLLYNIIYDQQDPFT